VEGEHLFGEAGLDEAISGLLRRHGELRVDHLLDEVCRQVSMPFEDDLTAVCIRRLAGRG
jgi:sigma-B regulation protein RsbU (phosphoserine phosphatase)